MLSSWFTNKIMPIKKTRKDSIRRVQNMLLEPNKESNKYYSPNLWRIQHSEENNVKKLSSIYEEKINAQATPITSRKIYFPSKKIEREEPSKKSVDQKCLVLDLFKSILWKDKEYSDSMKKMIDCYVNELEFESRFMPKYEQNQLIMSVFGNIQEIYKMHTEKFQPFLEEFIANQRSDGAISISTEVSDFAKKFINLCKNGIFNSYILHAVMEKETTAKRVNFYSYLMVYVEQKYQFAYHFDPTSQLIGYGLILEDISKEIKKSQPTKKCIKHLSTASKEFNNIVAKIKLASSK